MLKGDMATPSLILFSRVQMSWKCKNISCGRECTLPLPDGWTIRSRKKHAAHVSMSEATTGMRTNAFLRWVRNGYSWKCYPVDVVVR